MIGVEVGSYRITETLGQGGMGAVYVAEHTLLGKKAAVKMLLPELSKNQQIVQRFFNEARAATMIHHKGIIEVFDFGHAADGNAYIIMELLEGEALTDRMEARGQMGEAELLHIVRQLADALSMAHTANIVHRDLKPDNVFLCPDSHVVGGERVKVLDFGIAKLCADALGNDERTRTGSVMGSPAYMAPEQCRGLSTVDWRADIYSLGCMLYHMASGRVPFLGEGVGDIIAKQVYEQPIPPREINAKISPGLEQVILRCLAKEPDARYQSMQELVLALDQALAGDTGAQRGQSQPDSVNPEAATMMAGKATVGVTTTLGGAAAQVTARVNDQAQKRSKLPIFAALGVAAVGAVVGIIVLSGGGGGGAVDTAPQGAGSAHAGAASVTAAPIESASAAELAPARVEKMLFKVISVPDQAEVYRMPGGELLGLTPFREWKPEADGKAVYVVKKAGYVDQRVVIDASVGGRRELRLVTSAAEAASKSTAAKSPKAADARRAKRRRAARSRRTKKPGKTEQPATVEKTTTQPEKKKKTLWAK